jgi:hypothetical protein
VQLDVPFGLCLYFDLDSIAASGEFLEDLDEFRSIGDFRCADCGQRSVSIRPDAGEAVHAPCGDDVVNHVERQIDEVLVDLLLRVGLLGVGIHLDLQVSTGQLRQAGQVLFAHRVERKVDAPF